MMRLITQFSCVSVRTIAYLSRLCETEILEELWQHMNDCYDELLAGGASWQSRS